MEGYITLIDKTFEVTNEHYELNRDLALEYSTLINEVSNIRNKNCNYEGLTDCEISALLISKLKKVAGIQNWFIKGLKDFDYENKFKFKKLNKIYPVMFHQYHDIQETDYYKLKGVKFLYNLKNVTTKSELNFDEIDSDLWYNENLHDDNGSFFDFEDKINSYREDKPHHNINYIDDEEMIMTALRNGEGDRFGF